MPATIYLITGGARSGKSSYAQTLCEALDDSPIYIATANNNTWKDADLDRRIQKHQNDRNPNVWKTTLECPLTPSDYIERIKGSVVLLDCLTLWLTNYFVQEGMFTSKNEVKDGGDRPSDICDSAKMLLTNNNNQDDTAKATTASERALQKIQKEFDTLTEPWNCTFVFVTNELGSGIHASTMEARQFVDVHGWFNQYVARKAQKVIHMVCGCPHVLKDDTIDSNHSFVAVPSIIPTRSQALQHAILLDHRLSQRGLTMDTNGYFLIQLDRSNSRIKASFHSCMVNDKGEICDLDGIKIPCHGNNNTPEPLKVWEGRTAKEMTCQILEQWAHAKDWISVGHAGYLGREFQKAEFALYQLPRTEYQQD